nr:hypothetical protein [Tanacetum cinerariifolium]
DDYNSAITPVLSTEEPVDSLSMGDEHLYIIPATKSDEVIKSSVKDLVSIPSESEGIPEHKCNASPPDSELVSSEVMEIVIPEVGRIDDDIPLTIKDDNLRDKLLNVNLLIATIEALNDNPTPSSNCKIKSSSTSLNSLLEETSTFHNSLPEFENFYFDLGETSSGSTTTHSDISLLDYEAFSFDDDHIKEINSGSTITHSDISLSEYDSFIFDFTHEEFVDELAHIISPPEYDRFYFWNLPDPGELMSVLNPGIREDFSTTSVNLPIKDDHSPLLAYVVWIFVAYLTHLNVADDNQWKEHSYLGCSPVPFLSPLIKSSMGELVNASACCVLLLCGNPFCLSCFVVVQYSWKLEDSCKRILSSKS